MHKDFTSVVERVSTLIITDSDTAMSASKKIRLIKQYLEGFFFNERYQRNSEILTAEIIEMNSLTEEKEQEFVRNIKTSYFPFFDQKSFYDVLSGVKNAVFKCPRLSIYTSTHLDSEAKKKISLWCRKNISPTILLEIKYTLSITAGCGILWQMKYHEVSFESIFQEKRADINSLLTTHAEI